MKYKITAYPYAIQHGVVNVPDNVPEEDIDDYLTEHWGDIKFDEPDLDYAGTDFDKAQVKEEKLPTDITLPLEVKMPEEFWDSIYEYLQDKYGREAGMYPQAYGVEIKIGDIAWEKLEEE